MTKISEYSILTNPTDDDILIGTDVNSSDETRNFSVGSIISLANETIKPYKVYTALLTQTGTNAPVATVLENTLGGDITWSRNGTGEYFYMSSEILIPNKTTFVTGLTEMFNAVNISYSGAGDVGKLYTKSVTDNSFQDSLLLNTAIEIRVYN